MDNRQKKRIPNGEIHWQKHALQRMMQRGIRRREVLEAIEKGVVIEQYDNDTPFPSMLIAYIETPKPLHIVLAHDDVKQEAYIITAYIPDERYFKSDLITRKNDE